MRRNRGEKLHKQIKVNSFGKGERVGRGGEGFQVGIGTHKSKQRLGVLELVS